MKLNLKRDQVPDRFLLIKFGSLEVLSWPGLYRRFRQCEYSRHRACSLLSLLQPALYQFLVPPLGNTAPRGSLVTELEHK